MIFQHLRSLQTSENDLELCNVSSKENWRIQGWIRRRHFKHNHGVRVNQWPESLGTQFLSSWYNIKKFVDATNSKWRKSNEIRENIFSGKIWGDRIDNYTLTFDNMFLLGLMIYGIWALFRPEDTQISCLQVSIIMIKVNVIRIHSYISSLLRSSGESREKEAKNFNFFHF